MKNTWDAAQVCGPCDSDVPDHAPVPPIPPVKYCGEDHAQLPLCRDCDLPLCDEQGTPSTEHTKCDLTLGAYFDRECVTCAAIDARAEYYDSPAFHGGFCTCGCAGR